MTPPPKKKIGEKEVHFSVQFQVTVYQCGEVKEGTSNIQLHPIYCQEQRKMSAYELTSLLASVQLKLPTVE